MTELEEIRANRPPEPGFARVLLIIATVLWFLAMSTFYTALPPGSVMVALPLFFALFGAFGAVKGRQAGRVMTTVAIGVTWIFMVLYLMQALASPVAGAGLFVALDALSLVLFAVALAFLYHPNTNTYVRMVGAAMR
jgi:amino acid transporter